MITHLVLVRDDRDALTTDEIIGTAILLLFAGHETTSNLIGNGFFYSMKNRGEWDRRIAEPIAGTNGGRGVPALRWPVGCLCPRRRGRPRDGWQTIREGQRVFAFMNSANRDPEAFDDAERFDIRRAQNPHLTFGHGIHFCLGAPLARLERDRRDPARRTAAADQALATSRNGTIR